MATRGILRFLEHAGLREVEVEWTGEWPPPKVLCIAVGNTTGQLSIFDPATADAVAMFDVRAVARVWRYRRERASNLPDEVVESTAHLARAAEYRVEP